MPAPGEYVADGAARQAAWVLAGGGNAPPAWELLDAETYVAPVGAGAAVRSRYADVRDLTEGA